MVSCPAWQAAVVEREKGNFGRWLFSLFYGFDTIIHEIRQRKKCAVFKSTLS